MRIVNAFIESYSRKLNSHETKIIFAHEGRVCMRVCLLERYLVVYGMSCVYTTVGQCNQCRIKFNFSCSRVFRLSIHSRYEKKGRRIVIAKLITRTWKLRPGEESTRRRDWSKMLHFSYFKITAFPVISCLDVQTWQRRLLSLLLCRQQSCKPCIFSHNNLNANMLQSSYLFETLLFKKGLMVTFFVRNFEDYLFLRRIYFRRYWLTIILQIQEIFFLLYITCVIT